MAVRDSVQCRLHGCWCTTRVIQANNKKMDNSTLNEDAKDWFDADNRIDLNLSGS